MRIEALDIRACHRPGPALGLKGQATAGLEFLVFTLRCEGGVEASMFGFAGRSARGAGHLAAALRPFLLGRDAPGLGMDLDWDMIEETTIARL